VLGRVSNLRWQSKSNYKFNQTLYSNKLAKYLSKQINILNLKVLVRPHILVELRPQGSKLIRWGQVMDQNSGSLQTST
jgi:hypothetical protein